MVCFSNEKTVIRQTCTCDNSYHYFGITYVWHKVEAKVWYWKLTIFLRVVPLLQSEWWELDFVNIRCIRISHKAWKWLDAIFNEWTLTSKYLKQMENRWKWIDSKYQDRFWAIRFLVDVLGILEVLNEINQYWFCIPVFGGHLPSSDPSPIQLKKQQITTTGTTPRNGQEFANFGQMLDSKNSLGKYAVGDSGDCRKLHPQKTDEWIPRWAGWFHGDSFYNLRLCSVFFGSCWGIPQKIPELNLELVQQKCSKLSKGETLRLFAF